jgi:putative ABC transport system substrate-binding protein
VITRRKLLLTTVAAALTGFATRAQPQPAKTARIGFFYFGSRQSAIETGRLTAFLKGMNELGYAQGASFMLEERFADGSTDRLPALSGEAQRLKLDVIVATGTQLTRALQSASITTPIVFTVAADPVHDGLITSLSRPGGNITGLSNNAADAVPKLLELLTLGIPKLSRAAVLVNPTNPSSGSQLRSVRAAAQSSNIQLLVFNTTKVQEFDRAFTSMSQGRSQALIVLNDSFFVQEFGRISDLAIKHRLPSIYSTQDFAEAGGLLGYGVNVRENFARAAIYVDKILKGAKPADLPVEQPLKFSLTLNMKTARALGLKVPQEMLLRADKVIE